MLSIFLLVIVLCLVITDRWKNRKYVKLYEKLKVDLKCYPLIGHSYLFTGSDEDKMNGIKKVGEEVTKAGGIATGWFANRLYCVVTDPTTADVVLKNCSEKDFTMKFMKTVLGNGSLIAPVPIWRVRRKILTASFSVKNLNGFVDIFSKQSTIMMDLMKAKDADPISVFECIMPCAMDIVYECIYGIEVGMQKSEKKIIIQAFDDFRNSVSTRASRPWLHFDFIYNRLPLASKIQKHKEYLHGVADKAIKDKMKEYQDEKAEFGDLIQKPNKTFLHDLIRASQRIGGYKEFELHEETLVLTLASADSSTVGASFTCLILARHPEVQERVYEEVNEVFGDSSRPVTPTDLLRLKYLEAVIKETLRLYPPIPILVREVMDDVILPSGLTLLKGMGSMINIWALHRNPRYWGPDAEVFKADRFLDLTLDHPAQYMPFSYGPRNCLGPQFAMTLMKTVISTILRTYKILPAKSTDDPIKVKFDITIKDVDDFYVRLEPRTFK
ncbi:cytochrome p450 domain-containing protein [Phthorimaea operculella]|nr:cytochrome p450 domain-containing protein [Phthorimaea operculella]